MEFNYKEVTNARNPKSGMNLRDIPVHDPYILANDEDQTYYLYTSAAPEGRRVDVGTGIDRFGVMAYKSKDLKNWEGPFIVFTVPDGTWANPMHGTWAPEIHEYKGRYYLFVTLHNQDLKMTELGEEFKDNHWRGSTIAVSDSPLGPFTLLKEDAPYPPHTFMTLDGTLYIDEKNVPWMVYCHEWVQLIDGTIEAIRLTDDLTGTIGHPIHLFKGSDAPWLNDDMTPEVKRYNYVTDGCQLYRTKTNQLLMLWASYSKGKYVETVARSKSGTLQGPWEQLDPLVYEDSGHGMLFNTFDGKLMLILHSPFRMPLSRGYIYEMEDTGDNLKVIRKCEDLL